MLSATHPRNEDKHTTASTEIETEFMIMAFVLQLAIDRLQPDCTKLLAAQCNYHWVADSLILFCIYNSIFFSTQIAYKWMLSTRKKIFNKKKTSKNNLNRVVWLLKMRPKQVLLSFILFVSLHQMHWIAQFFRSRKEYKQNSKRVYTMLHMSQLFGLSVLCFSQDGTLKFDIRAVCIDMAHIFMCFFSLHFQWILRNSFECAAIQRNRNTEKERVTRTA